MRLLFVTPHLSTGGLPQFLLKKIELLNDTFDVWCIEWDNITGGQLVVQRQQIEGLLGDKLITLHDKEQFIQIVDRINPDVIHFEEFPETFVSIKDLNLLYNSKYKICETTHGTLFNKEGKLTTPDKSLFVSSLNLKQYYNQDCDFELIEYPVSTLERKKFIFNELNLDPNKFHILNVGLFTPGKNQGEIFEIARHFGDEVQFHFVGNQAGNFENYWKPLMENQPNNCVVWGERSDVWKFYTICDLFLFTSKLENKPLCINEALSYQIPILMRYLDNYSDIYVNDKINFLSDDIISDVKKIKDILGIKQFELSQTSNQRTNSKKISAYHILTDIDTDREVKSLMSLTKLEEYEISYNYHISKRYVDLPPVETCEYPDRVSMEPGGKLTPGHYGCYLGHKSAFYKGIQSDSDYILIFECDCVIDIDMVEFIKKVDLACDILNKTDLLMFSLGFHNNSHIIERNEDYWVVNKFYGAHAYLIPRKSFDIIKNMYENNKWNVTDLLFVEKLDQYKTGIFETPITKQSAGYSILDKIYNDDRH
jgi:GR25 family glycosyltransferase involved in LPS biosynthesis